MTAEILEDVTVLQKSKKRPRSMGLQSYLTVKFVGNTTKLITGLTGMDVTVHNQQAMPMKGPVVLVSNHESPLVDPLFLAATTPRNGAIMAKKELRKVPVLSQLMRLHGDIFIDRKDDDSRHAAKLQGMNVLAHEGMLALFPAGTTNHIGQDRDWAIGFAEMAVAAEATIIVVRLEGTGWLVPHAADRQKHSLKAVNWRRPIDVVYSDPITPAIYRGMSYIEIKDMCRVINRDLAAPPRL